MLVKGSGSIPVTVTVESFDPDYEFADVTGARVRVRKNPGPTVDRVADSFAVVDGDLVVVATLLAEDLNEAGTIYLTAIASRPAGDLPGLEKGLEVLE